VTDFISLKANDYFKNLMGLDDVTEKSILDINPTHSKDFLSEYILPAMDGEQTHFNIYLKNKDKHYSGSIFSLNSEMFAMTLIDITDINNTRKNLEESNARLEKSLDENKLLLREVNHRVKNNLNIIISLIHLESFNLDTDSDEYSISVLKNLENRIRSISRIHEMLYHNEIYSHVDSFEYLRKVCDDLSESYQDISKLETVVNLNIDKNDKLKISDAVPLGIIITEMYSNTTKYAFPETEIIKNPDYLGAVNISLEESEHQNIFTYADNGVGIPVNFDFRKSKSIGLILIESLSKQMGGIVEIFSGYNRDFIEPVPYGFKNELGVGTKYVIKFPKKE
jgi:two-component sensor histidine kinase